MEILIGLGAFAIGFLLVLLIWIIAKKLKKSAASEKSEDAEQIPEPAPAPVAAPVPDKPHIFALSREDVIDYIEVMRNNPSRFPVEPNVKEKTHEKLPDYLRGGERCFALMFERNELVFNFTLRMSPETAESVKENHSLEQAGFPSGKNWYKMVIDRSFENKSQVYRILDECYDFLIKEFAGEDDEAAKAEQAAIEAEAAESAGLVEESSAKAEEEYKAALEEYKAEHYTDFKITREEIAEDTRQKKEAGVSVVERPKRPYLPSSLKYQERTYAMLRAPRGEEKAEVIMIVRISDDCAGQLAEVHPEIRRAKFPKGHNWYYIPVDGAFGNKEAVYKILDNAKEFVINDIKEKAELEKKLAEEKAAAEKVQES